LLADFASPEKKFPPARDLDGLADDIATLSYEHALKTHARYRPLPDHAVSPETQSAFPGTLPLFESGPASDHPAHQNSVPPGRALSPPQPLQATTDADGRKSASVTVRLTRAEDEQLRQRAAEAGLTISAYLRSCAFEVESLRAQVKQTIAQMRSAEPRPAESAQQPRRRSAISRLLLWRKPPAA
jgi:hypothetical protein